MIRALSMVAMLLSVIACVDNEERAEPLDPAPFFGCYEAGLAPKIELGPSGLRVDGIEKPLEYRIEAAKVGTVLKTPLRLGLSDDGPRASRDKKERFYIFTMFAEPKAFKIVTYETLEYRRVSPSCGRAQ